MKAPLLGLAAILTTGCAPKVELRDYECRNENCTPPLGKELTGSQRPRVFLTEAYHPESDSVSYELRWRDTTTVMARRDSSKANIALVTYFTNTKGTSKTKWDLSKYNHVQDFTLIVRAPGYREGRVDWHIPPSTSLTRLNLASR